MTGTVLPRDDGPEGPTLALYRRVAFLQIWITGILLVSRLLAPKSLDTVIHVTLNALIVAGSTAEWWSLRTRGKSVPGAIGLPVLITATSISAVWFMSPESALFVLMSIALLFVRLPIWWALGTSIAALVITAGIYLIRWDADTSMLARLNLSGLALLLTVWSVRRTTNRINDQLRQTSRMLRETIESVGQGVAVLDQAGMVALMNARAVELLEVPPGMLEGPLSAEAFASLQVARGDLIELGEQDPAIRAYVSDGRNVLAPGIPERYTRRTRQGTWLEVRTHRMASGAIVRTWTDVTAYIEARKQAELAVRARTGFLASVSHEFRTPLNAILGYTRLAMAQEERTDQRERLHGVTVAATQLRQLVDGVIDLAGLDSGALTLAAEPFDVDPLVHRVTAPIATRCRARGVDFQIDLATALPARLVGDPVRLGGMIRTLAEFAERHTEQGWIGVRLEPEQELSDGLVLRVTVQDTGRGFTPAEHAVLTGHQPTSSSVGELTDGGAAIAFLRRYAELMGGTVGASSEYGKGTTLWMTLRLAAEAQAVAAGAVVVPSIRAAATATSPLLPQDSAVSPPATESASVQPTGADTPPSGSFMAASQRYVEQLLDDLQITRDQLDAFPYRAWVLSCSVFAITIGVLVRLPVDGTLPWWQTKSHLPSLLLMLWLLGMAIRHRRHDRPYRREAVITLGFTVLAYTVIVQRNGAFPSLLLAGATVAMYIAHPRWAARSAFAMMLGATAVAYLRFPGQELLFLRACAAAGVSVALMEWLMAIIERVRTTFGRATQALSDVSRNLVADNTRLAQATVIAEEAMHRRTDLMASVSHELRTPMNAILGLGNLLLQEPLAPRQREWIRRIRQNGQHLVELVNDLLDVTRIEAGRVRLESVPFALDEVLGQAADVLEREAVAKGLEVGIAVDDDVPRMLRGDRRRVAQLLLNYVSNAVKYTEHGRIELRVQAERVAGRIRLQVEVEDTGIGLTEAQRSRLFRPFEQLEPGATRFEGAGLGLSICKWLATAMDGDVGVESTRGVGSTFWFSVLLDDVPDAVAIEEPEGDAGDAETVAGVSRRLAGARVLVVDDNAINRIVTGEILRQAGVDVREADGGEAALLLAERHRPDVVLMDLQMPDVDGLEAVRRLRERFGDAAPPVIAITASPKAAVWSHCLEAGMVEVVEKPFDGDALRALVARWVPTTALAPAVAPGAEAMVEEAPADVIRADLIAPMAVLDRTAGLRLLGGDEAMYARLLELLEQEQRLALPAAAAALGAGDRERARPLIHSLAGACAILGAEGAHAAARELLALLAEEAPLPVCEDALELLRGEITRLSGEIARGALAPEAVRAA